MSRVFATIGQSKPIIDSEIRTLLMRHSELIAKENLQGATLVASLDSSMCDIVGVKYRVSWIAQHVREAYLYASIVPGCADSGYTLVLSYHGEPGMLVSPSRNNWNLRTMANGNLCPDYTICYDDQDDQDDRDKPMFYLRNKSYVPGQGFRYTTVLNLSEKEFRRRARHACSCSQSSEDFRTVIVRLPPMKIDTSNDIVRFSPDVWHRFYASSSECKISPDVWRHVYASSTECKKTLDAMGDADITSRKIETLLILALVIDAVKKQ